MPREKELPQCPLTSRGSCSFQTEGGACLGIHVPSRCTCPYLPGRPTWGVKTHRVPTLHSMVKFKLHRQPGQKMRF